MFTSVLLPVDLNHAASWQKALPAALQAAGEGARIHLLEIMHDLGAAMISSYLPQGFEQKAMEDLKAKLADFATEHVPAKFKAEVHVGHGHIAETILRQAETLDVDLIVMASHPPGDLRSLLIGSHADKVVHHAPLPVLVVR